MILYFSGTGNSEYAAKRIGKGISDEVIDLFDRIRSDDYSKIHSDSPWVVAAPTYAWRIPRIVENWLKNTELDGNRDIYFLLTCGGSIGNAGKYLKKLCDAKDMNYMGCTAVVMPENYIAMFTVPSTEEALQIIHQSNSVIDKAATLIAKGESFSPTNATVMDAMNSGIVNDIFYPLFVHAKKFYATDACITCGKCVTAWPVSAAAPPKPLNTAITARACRDIFALQRFNNRGVSVSKACSAIAKQEKMEPEELQKQCKTAPLTKGHLPTAPLFYHI